MSLGRPKSNDTPEKYRDSFELFQLSKPRPAAGANAVDILSDYLEWAIATELDGFRQGDIISISAVAEGVRRSRNTVAKSVEKLVTKGMIIHGKPKSPYRIVSPTPIFKDPSVVADEQISLTTKMNWESYFSDVRTCDTTDTEDVFSRLLVSELANSRDALIQASARQGWKAGSFQYYLRLRTLQQNGLPSGCLAEITYLLLSDQAAGSFSEKVERLREQRVMQISLYPLLEQTGLGDLRAGRTQVTVDTAPSFLEPQLASFIDRRHVSLEAFANGHPMLKWNYGIFRPDADPMVSFSVCYVRSDKLGIFIRNLDVERP